MCGRFYNVASVEGGTGEEMISDNNNNGAWLRIGRVDAFRPEGRGFESRCSRDVGTLGKSFTYSCM